jgi:hypothetical protein
MLKKCFPEAEITREREIGGPQDAIVGAADGRRTRADVFMRNGAAVTVFDVVIVEQSAPTYLQLGSDTTADAAARNSEASKIQRLHDLGLGDQPFQFVPLAIETTGRLGPKALAYFNDNIADTHRRHGEEFLAKLSSTIAKWNARMVLDARAKMERRTR